MSIYLSRWTDWGSVLSYVVAMKDRQVSPCAAGQELLNASGGKQTEKGSGGLLLPYEFRPWTLNKLALQRWAGLTMMYETNTLHCCYESLSANAAKARRMQTFKRRFCLANSTLLCSRQIQFLSWTYVSWLKQPTKTGEICHFLQDRTFLSTAAAMGCLRPSLSVCALGSRDISTSFLVPSCIRFLSFPLTQPFPVPITLVLWFSPQYL